MQVLLDSICYPKTFIKALLEHIRESEGKCEMHEKYASISCISSGFEKQL